MALSRHGRDFAYVGALCERAITQVGNGKMVYGLSGCADSGVVAVPLHEAIGDQLQCVFVDHGLLRKDEGEQVVLLFRDHYNIPLVRADASKQFLVRCGPAAFRRRCRAAWPPRWAAGP
jgi:GMP synthase PP-ATPase subunit